MSRTSNGQSWQKSQFLGNNNSSKSLLRYRDNSSTPSIAAPDDAVMDRFGRNSHVRRGLSGPRLWNGFCVFSGSSQSRRLSKAALLDRDLSNRALTSADGSPWRWEAGRSDLQVIGSYTRSCRCIIDPTLPGHSERSDILWEWVMRHE